MPDHPGILFNTDNDERTEPPPLTYTPEPERVIRVGINRRADNLADFEFTEVERLQTEIDTLKLETQAAFTEALLSLAEYAPSGGFVAPSNVRRILVRMGERLGVKV